MGVVRRPREIGENSNIHGALTEITYARPRSESRRGGGDGGAKNPGGRGAGGAGGGAGGDAASGRLRRRHHRRLPCAPFPPPGLNGTAGIPPGNTCTAVDRAALGHLVESQRQWSVQPSVRLQRADECGAVVDVLGEGAEQRGDRCLFPAGADHVEGVAAGHELRDVETFARPGRGRGFDGRVGIWHETYLIEPDKFESIYGNMPLYGLAAAGNHVKAEGRLATAKERFAQGG